MLDYYQNLNMTIYIDIEDKRPCNSKSFYFHPDRLSSLSHLAPDMFDGLKIKNCVTEKLSYNVLLTLFKALQPMAKCEIIIYNSNISQIENDCSIFERNAKNVGFSNFKNNSGEFLHPITKEYSSYLINFVKPAKVKKKKVFDLSGNKCCFDKKLANIRNSLVLIKGKEEEIVKEINEKRMTMVEGIYII